METKMNKKGLASWLIWSMMGLLLVSAVAVLYAISAGPTGLVVSSPKVLPTAVLVPAVTTITPEVIFIGVTTIPLNLATNQGIYNNIIITFSEPMDSATVNQNTFIVNGPSNTNINGVITSDTTKKIWTFKPLNNLKFNSEYDITITTGAKGISGNSLEKDFVWSFTTSYNFGGGSTGGSGGGSNGGASSSPSTPITPVLTTITLSPSSQTMLNGSSLQLNATSLDQSNIFINTTITYNTSNSTVATVNTSGVVSAKSVGTATITASNGTVNGTSAITVSLSASCPAVSVNLLTAGDFVILAGTGISSTGTTNITGDIGVGSGVTSTAITGNFALSVDASNTFATSALIVSPGKVYASDYIGPPATTPTKMNTAINDLGTVFTTANGLAACVTELGAGNIGGMTLTPGVYKWGTGVTIPTNVTLSGNSTDVWVFQISQTLDLSAAKGIDLIGGAQAKNVYWIVTGATTLGTTSVFNGNIISGSGTSTIALLTGATLNGRALGQTDVTLQANPVIKSV